MHRSTGDAEHSLFRGSADPNDLYPSPSHNEALARLHYLAENHRRLGVLVGPPGSGKTLLFNVFAGELRRRSWAVVQLSLLGLSADELAWTITAQLGTNPRCDQPPFQTWRALVDRLAEHRYQQLATAILLDDADEAADDVLTQVVRIVRLDPSAEARVTAILAADPVRVQRLGPRLLELAELRIELEPWRVAETMQYLEHRLAQAGCDRTLFEVAATSRLHELGQGIPRRVNQLAHLSLMARASRQLPRIDEETVQTVHDELTAAPLGSRG